MQKSMSRSYNSVSWPMWLAFLCCLGCAACEDSQQNKSGTIEETAESQQEVFIDLPAFLQNQNEIRPVEVEVQHDPVFKTKKQYSAYSLTEIIDSITRLHHLDKKNTMIVFVCGDGYQPSMTVPEILSKEKGYIAFKDRSLDSAANWPDSVKEKFTPYYLVWEGLSKDDQVHVWPFGLTGLRFTTAAILYKEIYPQHDAQLQAGFALFKSACLKCHSINKIGGTIGPELNYPKNITTYWREDDIIAFVRNPKAFRYNSVMPAITNLTENELEQIIRYIQSMENKKTPGLQPAFK